MQRLVLDIDKSLHLLIKEQAQFRAITIRKYILRAILEQLRKDLETL